MRRTVIFYKTQEGRCPVKEFLDSLDGKVAQKIVWVLNLLEDLDNIPSLYFKKLTGSDGIWECRIKYGSNIYRRKKKNRSFFRKRIRRGLRAV
jgi:hypothetical protein